LLYFSIIPLDLFHERGPAHNLGFAIQVERGCHHHPTVHDLLDAVHFNDLRLNARLLDRLLHVLQ